MKNHEKLGVVTRETKNKDTEPITFMEDEEIDRKI